MRFMLEFDFVLLRNACVLVGLLRFSGVCIGFVCGVFRCAYLFVAF